MFSSNLRRLCSAALTPGVIAGLLMSGSASAQVPLTGAGRGTPAGSTPTYVAYTAPACYTGSYISSLSFSSVPIGVGTVVIGIQTAGATGPPSAVTVGGNPVTGTVGTTANGSGLYYYNNAAGTSATIVFTTAGANGACIFTGLLTNLSSTTPVVPTATSGSGTTQPFTGPVTTVLSNGIAVAMFGVNDSTAGTGLPLTWVNATRDASTESEESATSSYPLLGSAHMTASATPTAACGGASCNYNNWSIIVGAWR